MSTFEITVKRTDCPDGCVDIKGGNHEPEVNPVAYGITNDWRLECPACGTVLKIFPSYNEAVRAGIQHAVNPIA